QALDKRVAKGRLQAAEAEATVARLRAADGIDALAGCALYVEAVVEDLEIKRKLFLDLEALADERAILATNTSSISVTAIAAPLRRPERLAGLHFFNPAPLMPLVEIVSGAATDCAVANVLYATA